MPLLHELSQRKIVQWALAYAAGAWTLLQVLGFVAETFGWPDVLLRSLTVLVAAGFPLTLVLAWYHGERGRQRASGPELLMVAALLTLAGTALAWVRKGAEDGTAPEAATGAAGVPGRPGAAPDGGPPAGGGAAVEPSGAEPASDPRSIAVLAFDDLSPSGDQGWFADGIAEEILTALARVQHLRVSARQSSFAFRGRQVDVRRIGDTLGVATVLEGSVRRGGDSVWITAQLIDAESGFHLWGETYAHLLTAENLRGIQSDVARHVAHALELRLLSADAASEAPPDAAYDAYLLGRHRLRLVQTGDRDWEENAARGIEHLRRAVALAPEWAPGWAALGEAYHWAASGGIEPDTYYPESLAALRRAIELDSTLAAAHNSLGFVLHNWELDFEGAERAYRRAFELDPDQQPHGWALFLLSVGRPNEATDAYRRATVKNPLSLHIREQLGLAYMCAGRLPEAIEQLRGTLALDPSFAIARRELADALSRSGRPEEALARLDEAPRSGAADQAARALVLARAGRREGARERLERLAPAGDEYAQQFRIATLAALSDREVALAGLQEAVRARAGWILYHRCFPDFQALRDDPRYARLLDRIGFPES